MIVARFVDNLHKSYISPPPILKSKRKRQVKISHEPMNKRHRYHHHVAKGGGVCMARYRRVVSLSNKICERLQIDIFDVVEHTFKPISFCGF